jgi:hypothetical protein
MGSLFSPIPRPPTIKLQDQGDRKNLPTINTGRPRHDPTRLIRKLLPISGSFI